MKVKVKKEDYQSMLPAMFVMLIFAAFSVPILIYFLHSLLIDFSIDNFMNTFSHMGIAVLFASVFFSFDIYFIYLLLKKPQKYLAILKKIKHNESQNITTMTFETPGNFKEKYNCYIEGIHNLKKENQYVISIKEFNHHIRSVEDFTINIKDNISETGIGITMKPIIGGMAFIFISMALFIISYSIYTKDLSYLFSLIIPAPFLVIFYFIFKSNNQTTKL